MEEPVFDSSFKKKKKKKTVAFSEDPLGAEADPTTPAPPLETNGDSGPATVHEQMVQNGAEGPVDKGKDKDEEDDFKAMFGDVKKKKKKKEIPLDLVSHVGFSFSDIWLTIIREMTPQEHPHRQLSPLPRNLTFRTSRKRRKSRRKRPHLILKRSRKSWVILLGKQKRWTMV